jgi:hypothetical protein
MTTSHFAWEESLGRDMDRSCREIADTEHILMFCSVDASSECSCSILFRMHLNEQVLEVRILIARVNMRTIFVLLQLIFTNVHDMDCCVGRM